MGGLAGGRYIGNRANRGKTTGDVIGGGGRSVMPRRLDAERRNAMARLIVHKTSRNVSGNSFKQLHNNHALFLYHPEAVTLAELCLVFKLEVVLAMLLLLIHLPLIRMVVLGDISEDI